jgi:hypothetical protein
MGFGFSDLNPMNWSAGGSTAAQQVGRTLTDLGAPKAFGKNATSALSHPLSFSTGGLLGGKGGTFEVPHISGGSRTNALSGSDQYGNSANKNRDIVGALAAIYGGEALFGGGGSSTAGNSADLLATGVDPGGGAVVTGGGATTSTAPGIVGSGTTSVGDSAAMGVGTQAGDAAVVGNSVVPTTATTGGMSTAQEVALGLAGVNAIQGLTHHPAAPNADPQKVGTAAGTTANALIDNFNKGQLQPTDQYNIAKWQQDQLQSSKDYYAKAGLADSSMATEAAAGISAQGEAMKGQALTNMLHNGLAAAGVASNYSSQQVQLQVQQDQQLQQSQSNFMQTLAMYGMMA